MINELQEGDWKSSNRVFTVRNHNSNTTPTDPNMRKLDPSPLGTGWRGSNAPRDNGLRRDREYHSRSVVQDNAKKSNKGNYFGLESMLLLVCLAASMLILPIILPPLPPPPYMLLLLPIGILGLLMILAFMPSNVRDLTYTYM